jgi:hypothetical protein
VNRITDQRQAEAIAEAYRILPIRIANRLEFVHIYTGPDPLWAGLHSFEKTFDGRSYRDTACCVFPSHSSDGNLTIALPLVDGDPTRWEPRTVIHELGHALHFLLGFRHLAAPVTAYARSDRWEAFAEAFATSIVPGYGGDLDVLGADVATRQLFEELAAA